MGFPCFLSCFFIFSPRPRVIYFYAVAVCTRTAHLSLFVFIPSACLSTVETNSPGKAETSSSAPCPGHQAAENHKNLNGACSTSAETGVSSRDDPDSSGMSQRAGASLHIPTFIPSLIQCTARIQVFWLLELKGFLPLCVSVHIFSEYCKCFMMSERKSY